MVLSVNECTYCRVVDIRGLYSPINHNTGAVCRDCYNHIPDWIDMHDQGHKYLKARIKKVKT
jgi:hypothetical protein